MIDKSMTGSYQINLPKDLLSEARKQPKPKKEHLKVEGWRTSWLTRVSEMLVGKDSYIGLERRMGLVSGEMLNPPRRTQTADLTYIFT